MVAPTTAFERSPRLSRPRAGRSPCFSGVTVSTDRPLRKFHPDELDSERRAVYDAIAGGPRAIGPQQFRLTDDEGLLEGPFNAFLLQPALGGRLEALGSAIRYETALSDRYREIAILVVAAHWESAFEQYAHEAVGQAVGLTEAELTAIRVVDEGVWTDPVDAMIAKASRALVESGDLDDDMYASLVDAVGEPGLFELLVLVGYYAALALQLRVFRVALPDGIA